ncbi:hypothetical protein [Ktedonospora formicarum]|uniref:Uncharacterized protein n=1 Tax=Ktedonospora formicarum TaxID=2778364 RepID=A0A8J3I2E5_9CHLR|nr:hypothetical protein [Ktedonospora formicarum]GHO43659.1 hypothetical protein KSX_18220 [Ktedonospora formicarum]
MLSRGLQIILVVALIVFLIFLFRPEYVANAGNALIKAVDGSDVSGTAQLTPKATGNGSSFQVNLQGLKTNARYVVTLDKDRCGSSSTTTLGTISSDQSGNATISVERSDLSSALQNGLWVDVRRENASGPSIACGQVKVNSQELAQFNSTPTPTSTSTNLSSFITPTTTNSGSIWDSLLTGFPQTGAGPGDHSSYDNYKYPRKR